MAWHGYVDILLVSDVSGYTQCRYNYGNIVGISVVNDIYLT